MVLDQFFVGLVADGSLVLVQSSAGAATGSSFAVADTSETLVLATAAPIPAQAFVLLNSSGDLITVEVSPVLALLGSSPVTLPVTIKVGELSGGPFVHDIDIQVIDIDDFNQLGARWASIVVLDGVDISTQCTGAIEVEAEEGQARIASFKMVPPDTNVVIPAWVGKLVTINFATYASNGDLQSSVRVFTGFVDVPTYDPVLHVVNFQCTDDLNNYVGQLTREQISALIGGHWSPFVFNPTMNSYEYFQAQASTVPKSVDMNPYRVVRSYGWASSDVADLKFDNTALDNIIDGSLEVEVANRSQIVNKVVIEYGFRFPRLKARSYVYSFQLPAINALVAPNYPFVFSGFTLPSKEMIQRGAGGISGWDLMGVSFYEIPANQAIYGGIWYVNPGLRETLCWGGSVWLMRRWAQPITEQYTITVSCPLSITEVGILQSTDSGAMEVKFDSQAWESSRLVPPTDLGEMSNGEPFLDYHYEAGNGRVESDAAVLTLIAKASTTIKASHRGSSVRFQALLNPVLDLPHTVEIDYDRLRAKGKVRQFVFSMDNDTGAATMDVKLALSSISAVGIQQSTPLAAPAPPPVPDPPIIPPPPAMTVEYGAHAASGPLATSWQGYRGNYSVPPPGETLLLEASYPTEFRVTAPDILAVDTDPIEYEVFQEILVAIPMDVLSMSALGVPTGTGFLRVTTFAPGLVVPISYPATGQLVVRGYAPKLSFAIAPAKGSMVVTGKVPVIALNIIVSRGVLVLTGWRAVHSIHMDVGAMVITGQVPTVV
jgi:hypothetical protein